MYESRDIVVVAASVLESAMSKRGLTINVKPLELTNGVPKTYDINLVRQLDGSIVRTFELATELEALAILRTLEFCCAEF